MGKTPLPHLWKSLKSVDNNPSIGARGARTNAEPPRAHPTSCVQETQDTLHVLPHSLYVRIVHMDYDLQEMENAETLPKVRSLRTRTSFRFPQYLDFPFQLSAFSFLLFPIAE